MAEAEPGREGVALALEEAEGGPSRYTEPAESEKATVEAPGSTGELWMPSPLTPREKFHSRKPLPLKASRLPPAVPSTAVPLLSAAGAELLTALPNALDQASMPVLAL